MKIIGLGDTHGRNDWEKIVLSTQFDKVVFVGDYFDSRELISAKRQIDNFKRIIDFKKANVGSVILLFGNHDFHYLPGIGENYSGYQPLHAFDIQEVLVNALDEDLIQMSFQYDEFLFTHAGVTKTWSQRNNIDPNNVADSINALFKYKPIAFQFASGKNHSKFGDDITQSPIWVRPASLLADGLDEFIQIVGHTPVQEIMLTPRIIQIDAMGTSSEFLCIDNSQISIHTTPCIK